MITPSHHPRSILRLVAVMAGLVALVATGAAQASHGADVSGGGRLNDAQLRCAVSLTAYADILAESMYDLGDVCGASEAAGSALACADATARFDAILAGSGYEGATRDAVACVEDDAEIAAGAEPIAQVGLIPR